MTSTLPKPETQPTLSPEELRQAEIEAMLLLRQAARLQIKAAELRLRDLGWSSREERNIRHG